MEHNDIDFDESIGLEPGTKEADRFRRDCQNVFNTRPGKRIIERLLATYHPYVLPVPITKRNAGRRDVINTLFGYSVPEHKPIPAPHGDEESSEEESSSES